MIIVGIDPHITKPFAIAVWNDGKLTQTWKSKDMDDIGQTLGLVDRVFIENQYYGGNSRTLTDLAHSCGKIMGLCEYLDIPYTLVMPTVWQSAFGLTGKKPKDISTYGWKKLHAQQICIMASKKSGQKIEDDDIASAVLLGLWGIQHT